MVRLSLSDLEEAIKNPIAYREKLTQGGTSRFFPPKSYFTVLRNALFKFHSSDNNLAEGQDYLIAKLAGFKDDSRKQDTIDQFNWYIQDYSGSNLLTFSCRQNVVIRPGTSAISSLEWSGQVSRLDIRPVGGYAAWLFRNKSPEGWFNELRMPLIQNELSNCLNMPLTEISIGIYSFQERFIDFRCYSAQNVADAQKRLQDLSLALDL
jgi:hypothetical protein